VTEEGDFRYLISEVLSMLDMDLGGVPLTGSRSSKSLAEIQCVHFKTEWSKGSPTSSQLPSMVPVPGGK
jgi:hypothetical protein